MGTFRDSDNLQRERPAQANDKGELTLNRARKIHTTCKLILNAGKLERPCELNVQAQTT